ncbi:hypothetical protein PG990_014052 [Apiospora arundinis]|jgi:hypothetical protein|uniref:Uncharacterized protein n=1 Tax=Apiospora arundinis TaxID=335852 RepID=A0ABR2I8U5_9PEZI
MSLPRSTRPFSTTTGVYPAYLPQLHRASRVEKKLVPVAVATVGIGYGVVKFKQFHTEQQAASQFNTSAASDATKHQAENLMNAYGDRSSLAELEAAVKHYESSGPRR